MAKKKGSKLGANLTYREIAAIPMGTRQSLLNSPTIADMIRNTLGAGQMAAMFPTHYKEGANSLAGQRSDSTVGGGATSGYSPRNAPSGPGAPSSPPGYSPTASPAPKTGLTPSEFRRIESNPLLAGYGDQFGRQGAATMGQGTQTQGIFTPRERETLKFIAAREGAQDPNIIFGGERYKAALGLDKRPLTDMSVAEVLEMQKKMTKLTGADGIAGGVGTSAVGTGQMVRGTLIANLQALGIPEDQWSTIKFDQTLQERLTLQNFKSSGIGDPNGDPRTWNMARLGAQYESLDTSKGFKPMSEAEITAIASAKPELELPNPTQITSAPVTAPPQQGSGELAAVETKGMTAGQNEALMAAEQGAVRTDGTGTDHYATLRAGSGTKIGKDDPIWASVDPALRDSMHTILDRDTGLVNRDTLLAADAQAKVLRANGYIPRPVSGGDNHSENHGAGRDANYAIDMGAAIKDPKTGEVTNVNVGTGLSYELKRDMAFAAALSGDGSGQNLRIGFPTDQSGSSMHTQFDTGKDSALWGYDRRTAAGSDPTRHILETTPDGQRFLSDMAGLKDMRVEDKSQLLASLTGGTTGTNVASQTTTGQQARTDADNLLALADSGGQPPSTGPANTATQTTTTVASAPVANTTTATVQSSQDLAAVEQPASAMVPQFGAAAGAVLTEPHTAINDRTGERVKIAEKGTGGEVLIPKSKINAAELGQQPYQMQQPQAPQVINNQIIQQQAAAAPQQQDVSASYSFDSHPEQGATLGKAYARARMSNYTPSNDYVSFGHPVV